MGERFTLESRPSCTMIKVPEGIFDVPEGYEGQDICFALYFTEDEYGAVILNERGDPLLDTVFSKTVD